MSIRKNLSGTTDRPRISVFRSNEHIYAQIIDDSVHKTLVAEDDTKMKSKKKPLEVAKDVGLALGKKAIAKKIVAVVFDRRGYKYHGRVKALSEGLREAGLKF